MRRTLAFALVLVLLVGGEARRRRALESYALGVFALMAADGGFAWLTAARLLARRAAPSCREVK